MVRRRDARRGWGERDNEREREREREGESEREKAIVAGIVAVVWLSSCLNNAL